MRGVLLLLPLLVVNVWHAIIIYLAKPNYALPVSISESAVSTTTRLHAHRVVHVLGALCFVTFAAVSSHELQFIAVVLIAAAVLDVMQAMFLSEKTDHSPFNLYDRHQLFAWAMAAGYMLFCILFAIYSRVAPVWAIVYVTLLFGLAVWNRKKQFTYFWAVQMLFFVLTSAMMWFAACKSQLLAMQLHVSPREFFLLSVMVMIPTMWYVFRGERFGSHFSISLHASARRSATWVFGVGLFIATVLLGVYYTYWLIPKYDYPVLIRAMLLLSSACSAILALIPHYEDTWRGKIHAATAYVMAAALPLTLLLHAVYVHGTLGRGIALTGAAIQIILTFIFYRVKSMRQKFYLLQSLFLMTYLVCVGVFGYLY